MSGLFAKNIEVNNTENKVGALRIQSSSQGMPIAIAYGMNRVTPNNIWYGNFTAYAHVTQETQGGKGGGGEVTTTTTTYTYSVGLLLALCEGPLQEDHDESLKNFMRLWSGKAITTVSSNGFSEFIGSYTQNPFAFIETNLPAEARAYRGTAYAAHSQFDLGSSSSVPNLTIEVLGRGLPSPCQPDVNPAFIITDLLTNENYGAGWPADRLDDLNNFDQFCAASNFMASPVYSAQQPAAELLKELCLIGNSAPIWSEGVLKIRPYGDANVSHTPYQRGGFSTPRVCELGEPRSFTPDLTPQYSLGYSDFKTDPGEDPVRVHRKRQSDTFNSVQVEILDRDNDYNILVCEAKDQWNIEAYGLRPAKVVTCHAICDKNIGRAVAQAQLQRTLYVRNEFVFRLGWKYARLEPMDIVALNDEKCSLTEYLVRITQVEEDEDGFLTITAEDLSEGSGTPGIYGSQGGAGAVIDQNAAPGDAQTPVIFQPPVELSGVPQIWIATAGNSPVWGGAQVWASGDGSSYALMGTVVAPCRYGELTANFPAGSDPDTVNTLSVSLDISKGVLNEATPAQADAGDTLCWLDGEILAYSDTVLTAPYNYDLDTYIRRGLRCSVPAEHLAGAPFVRLDGAIGKFAITQARVGTTIRVKLVSFNVYGRGLQDIAVVDFTEYVVQPLGIVAANGVIPDVINAQQVLCIPPNTQFSVTGRLTNYGRVNLDGRLIIV